MNDYPSPVNSPYGDISCCDEATQKWLQENHDKWNMDQMRAIRDFVEDKCNKLRQACEKECTIEDFEEAKKQDIDDDQEVGEK